MGQPVARSGLGGVATAIVCALLLLTFTSLAWMAARAKSPTYDEPLHAVGGWLHLHDHDFRVNPEDPPLWQYWLALPNGRGALHADTNSAAYRAALADVNLQWPFVVNTLYP